MKLKNMTLFTIFCLFAGFSLADGKAFSGKDFFSMFPIRENDQRAIISHKNGKQKMLIAVSLPLPKDEKAIWIFPVPGDANSVKVDLFESFPKLTGYDPHVFARKTLSDFSCALLSTQLIPACCCPAFGSLKKGSEIHLITSVDKWGLHAEIISADSMEALKTYLHDKKVSIQDKDLESFTEYLNKKYVLVLTWIESTQDLIKHFPAYASTEQDRWPAVYVEFPTDTPFYPMKPTSGYGNDFIKIHISVFGNYTLENYDYDLKQYKLLKRPKDLPLSMQQDIPEKNIWYTANSLWHLPASEFTEDLYFKPIQPPNTTYEDFIVITMGTPLFGTISWIIFAAAISYLTGGILGLLVYQKWSGYAAFGLTNMATILFLLFMAYRKKGKLNLILTCSGTAPNKRFLYVILFPFLFCLLTVLIMLLISLPLK